LTLAALAAMLALPPATPAFAQAGNSLVAPLQNGEGKVMGQVTLRSGIDGLAGKIEVKGLTPGAHGMHVHAVGKCGGDGFSAAGGHLNPTGKAHGLENPMGAHMGDLPTLQVGEDGKATAYFTVKGKIGDLLDIDGAAFVVHAGPDDQKTDPSGNSGARVLCGVFAPGLS
jgi:Cu-Zn family superoxide dismutase